LNELHSIVSQKIVLFRNTINDEAMDDQNVDGENKASPEFVEKDLKDKTLQIS
jgi:hypothetical protein